MKDIRFEALLHAARPDDATSNPGFTDKVMSAIAKPEIFSAQLRNMSVNKKETLFMKFKHLPKLAIVAIAVGALAVLTGTSYAVVKTIEGLNNVKVNEMTTNEFGRQEVSVGFEGCKIQSQEGVKYELKKGSGLSNEDGVRALQARCDMEAVSVWYQEDQRVNDPFPPHLYDGVKTVKEIRGDTLVTSEGEELSFPTAAKLIAGGKEVDRSELKVGDVFYNYADILRYSRARQQPENPVIFKVTQAPKYYSLEMQSYVHPRAACRGNAERECLQSNHINQVVLIVTYGGAQPSADESVTLKEVQGKVVSYDTSSIRLDVGKGVHYTIKTPSNIIDGYNQGKVYSLAGFDNIYSKTAPEDLMIKAGDSLAIYYQQPAGAKADTLDWSEVLSVGLMVERIPNNLDVLRKY